MRLECVWNAFGRKPLERSLCLFFKSVILRPHSRENKLVTQCRLTVPAIAFAKAMAHEEN